MENYEIVSIEAELDRMRDERAERPETKSPATRKKIGCAAMLFYFVAGIALLKLIGDFLMITGGN